jgi:Arc/MetJ-type ribon-helix-helix transcriptional regulator
MENLINLGIYPTKSDIVRHALIHFLDRDHKMLPEIQKDDYQIGKKVSYDVHGDEIKDEQSE